MNPDRWVAVGCAFALGVLAALTYLDHYPNPLGARHPTPKAVPAAEAHCAREPRRCA